MYYLSYYYLINMSTRMFFGATCRLLFIKHINLTAVLGILYTKNKYVEKSYYISAK